MNERIVRHVMASVYPTADQLHVSIAARFELAAPGQLFLIVLHDDAVYQCLWLTEQQIAARLLQGGVPQSDWCLYSLRVLCQQAKEQHASSQ